MTEAATKIAEITKDQIVEMEDVVNDLANAVIQNVMSSKWEGNPIGLCSGISIRIAAEICLHVMMGDTVEDLIDDKEFNKVLSALTVTKYFQLEHRLDLLVDLKLASELPSLLVQAPPAK